MKNIEVIWLPETQQQIFRELMQAMSRPGTIKNLVESAGHGNALRGLLATLMDAEASLCDQAALLDKADWQLLQCRQQDAEQAAYVVCDGLKTADFSPKLGTLSSPEFATTLIIKVDQLGLGGCTLTLRGPGVDDTIQLNLTGLHPAWLEQRQEWNAAFPLGVDILLVDDNQVTALPRTTQIEVKAWDM